MPWQKGQSGNPSGAKPEKPWRDAIKRALARAAAAEAAGKKPSHSLDRIADKLLAKAAAGDIAAMKEIGDRRDGRVPQVVMGDDEGGPIRHVVHWIGERPDAEPAGD